MTADQDAIAGLFTGAPIGLGVLGPDLRWREVNAAMAALQDRRAEQLIGHRPSETHEASGAEMEAFAREALAAGETLGRRLQLADRWFEVAAFPLDGGGVGTAAVEITERVAAERREALMARASQLLSTALNVKETAELVAALAVPELADWCVVELLGDDHIERAAYAHADPTLHPVIAEFDRRFPLDPDSPSGPPLVIRTGEPELITDVDDASLEEAAQDPDLVRMLRELGFRSTLVVPLIARGRILGDLALATGDRSGRRLGPETLDIARSLADRAAVALDNAALYAQRDLVAVSLQEELLPPSLPSIPGLDVAARYSAAGEGNEVGGDFYDVFASGTGWQVVIGDVVGKGPAAAAVTGLARHTLRVAGAYEGAPTQLLRVLNDALLAEQGGKRIASVACVRLDPDRDGVRLTTSVAGHPLPLVVGVDGAVRELGRFGSLLGVEDELVVFNTVDHLGPGEVLVLYTDGVIEAHGRGGAFGEGQLQALLSSLGGQAPTRILQRIEAAVLATTAGRPRDDVAMIALRARQIPTSA